MVSAHVDFLILIFYRYFIDFCHFYFYDQINLNQDLIISKTYLTDNQGNEIRHKHAFEVKVNQYWVVYLEDQVQPGNYSLHLEFAGNLTRGITSNILHNLFKLKLFNDLILNVFFTLTLFLNLYFY